jgi:hypothetical protein
MPKGLNSACQRRHIFNGLKPRRCFIGPSLLTLANEIALRLGDYHPLSAQPHVILITPYELAVTGQSL